MNLIAEINEINQTLKVFSGGRCSFYLCDRTFQRLLFLIEKNDNEQVVFLLGVACESIKGKFAFSNSKLEVFKDEHDNSYKVFDNENSFELVTRGGVVIAIGLLGEFGDNFDDFIKKDTLLS